MASINKSWGKEQLPVLVRNLVRSYRDSKGINLVDGHDLPDRERVFACLDRLLAIVFPGIIGGHTVTRANLSYLVGDLVSKTHLELAPEVERAIRYYNRTGKSHCRNPAAKADVAVTGLLEALPRVRSTLKQDVQAAYDGDPAATGFEEVIFSYPCLDAIATYRFAHELYRQGIPLIPRLWTERAHSRTGIDINPGAVIGSRFFIDHGTGVVVGETCEIGRNVALYQGVTLGALAPAKGRPLAGKKRHPTIEDNVIIYAGATILGNAVIGAGTVVGGNVWLTRSVPPKTRVFLSNPDLVYLGPGRKTVTRKKPRKKRAGRAAS